MNEQQMQAVVAAVLAQVQQAKPPQSDPIPIETSARHVHVTAEALEQLFGPGAQLSQQRALSQPGEFLSGQRVNIVTPKSMLAGVAVLGPVRAAVQVELSMTDCRALGIAAPVRLSGDLRGAAEVLLIGPAGTCRGAAIVAQSHIHMTPEDARRFGVANGQPVSVRVQTPRPVTFEQVPVRISETFALAMHLDFDEANACALTPNCVGLMQNAECRMQKYDEPGAVIITEKVITEMLAKQLCKAGENITLRKGTIITPAAKDIFSQARIIIEMI